MLIAQSFKHRLFGIYSSFAIYTLAKFASTVPHTIRKRKRFFTMSSTAPLPAFELTPEQKYEFDLQGYILLEQHYDAARRCPKRTPARLQSQHPSQGASFQVTRGGRANWKKLSQEELEELGAGLELGVAKRRRPPRLDSGVASPASPSGCS